MFSRVLAGQAAEAHQNTCATRPHTVCLSAPPGPDGALPAPALTLGVFLPPRECYELPRECCRHSEVGLGKFLPPRECYELPRECCKDAEMGIARFLLPASVTT